MNEKKYDLKRQVSLMAEKTLSTFIQTFVMFLVGMNSLGADAASAALLAAIAAGGTALLAALPVVPDGLPFATDLFFRAARGFLVTFGTLYFAANAEGVPVNMSVSGAKAAAFSAIMVVLVLLKGAAAKRSGDTSSAAVLPSKLDPACYALAA